MVATTGTEVAWLGPRTLHAQGEWTWQLRDDEIADISYQGQHLLRSVRAVSRDADWGTRDLRLTEVRSTATGVQMDVTVHGDDGATLLGGTITVEAVHARLTISARLQAQVEVWTNRTGLVVLHPPQLAGTALAVTHPGGEVETTVFPRAISPHQPALEIAGLTWTHSHAGEQVDVDLRFEGDVFEMEDQRNWTDASFKTYNRPLSLPFPYRVGAGEVVHQQVTVSARASATATWAGAAAAGASALPGVPTGTAAVGSASSGRGRRQRDTIRLSVGGPLPAIAVGAATAPDPAPDSSIDVTALEGAVHVVSAVLVELELNSSRWRAALARALGARAPLDVRVVLDHTNGEHLAALDALVRELGALHDGQVVRIAAFDVTDHVTDAPTAAALRAAMRSTGLHVPVVGGARSHFTELNREQARLAAGLDGIVFSTTPLFHAVGTEQLIESVAVQRTVAEQAVIIAGGLPVHVGPVTLRPRFNNVATTPALTASSTSSVTDTSAGLPEGYGAQQPGNDDPRQAAPELAAWTIASAAALAVPGVASLTYFEQWGPRGICTARGAELPVAAALRALADLAAWAEAAGGERLVGASPDGLVWAVGATTTKGTTVLAANLDMRARRLAVETPRGALITGLEAGAWSTSTLPG